MAIAAESAGFGSFTLPDSLCGPAASKTPSTYKGTGDRELLSDVHSLEPFSLIPEMGAVTERIRFTTSALELAIRKPVTVARPVSASAVLTQSRFASGVGIGPYPEDSRASRIPCEPRSKPMDEMIATVRRLTTGEYFGYDGESFPLDPIDRGPTSSQKVSARRPDVSVSSISYRDSRGVAGAPASDRRRVGATRGGLPWVRETRRYCSDS